MPFRYDIATIGGKAKRLPNGTLQVPGRLTRAGVFVYRNPDGTERREYRPADEVFRADSLATFSMVVLTNEHPAEPVTATNARQFAVGTVGENVRKDADHVAAPIFVFDAAAIADIEAGKVQLSCGYTCDYDPTPGEVNGERYDGVQRNIRGNHVALVDAGRAGPTAALRFDSESAMMVDQKRDDVAPTKENKTMDPELKAALEDAATQKARADRAEAELATATARADKAEADRDIAAAELATEKKLRTDADDSMGERVKARVALETVARTVLDADTAKTVGDMTDTEIKRAVVKRVDGDDVPEDKSADYLAARFDSAVLRAESVSADALVKRVDISADSRNNTEAAARQKMLERADSRFNA